MAAKEKSHAIRNPRQHVKHGDCEKSVVRRIPDSRNYSGNHDNHAKRMSAAKINILEARKPPGAYHQQGGTEHQYAPADRNVNIAPIAYRVPILKMDRRSDNSRACRNRHPDEILLT